MIKATEYRLGNLFMLEGKIFKVEGIDQYSHRLIAKEGADFFIVNNPDPIPLQPEWLERCGYIKYVGNTGQEIYKSPVGSMALYKLAGSKDWIIGANDFSGGYLNLCTISYFHQLQNLYFALTGEELTINNEHLQTTS